MTAESLPVLAKAPIPVQTHTLRLEERYRDRQSPPGGRAAQKPGRMETFR